MKFCYSFITAFSLLINTTTFASSNNTELNFVKEVSHQLRYIKQNKNLWPGFDISQNPAIFYFDNNHNYAFHFSPVNPNWQKLPNTNDAVYFLEKDEYGINHIPWAFGVLIDKQISYLFRYITELSLRENIQVLLHERFHIYQFEKFPKDLFWLHTYTGFRSVENVKLSFLEFKILKDYLQNNEVDYLKDYLAVTLYREKLIGKDAAQYEGGKENIEGMAEYYAWHGMDIGDKERQSEMADILEKNCQLENIIKCQIHNRYYYTGAVLGIALDKYSPVIWKEKLVKDKLSLRQQLYQLFPLTDVQINERVKVVKHRYDYENAMKPIEEAMTAYQNALANEQEKYQQQEGIVLNIQKTPCNVFGVISSTKEYFISSDETLEVNVKGNTTCNDDSIKIDFNYLPYSFTSNTFRYEFKISADTKIKVNDKMVSPQAIVDKKLAINFNKLSLLNSQIKIEINKRNGVIKAKDNKIILAFDSVK